MNKATKRVLLISNSTLYGSGYLDHAESEIHDFLGDAKKVSLFITLFTIVMRTQQPPEIFAWRSTRCARRKQSFGVDSCRLIEHSC